MLPRSPFINSENNSRAKRGGSVDITQKGVFSQNKAASSTSIWRPSSLVNLVNPNRKRNSQVFDSAPTNQAANEESNQNENTALIPSITELVEKPDSPVKSTAGGRGSLVTIILVDAKGLPDTPTDGSSHGVYCKLRLGSQMLKSKRVQNLHHPEWREQFQLHLYKDHLLKVSLWDKGKQKTFMGSSILDLSGLETERTHELWQKLDDGYGVVHLSVTICNIRRKKEFNNEVTQDVQVHNKHALFNRHMDWKLVGQLYVKVVSAKGLSGKPNAYCTLEVDNEKVRTYSARGTPEPLWNKSFVFNVYDVTSTLDLKVFDGSLMTLHNEMIGRISVPLLRIRNGEMKWYALKDKSKRNIAKGNCPRILLEMSFFWNPIKASLRVFQPKEVKYIKKSQKFDIALVYKNMEFIRDTFLFLVSINEGYKRLFEWENQELSVVALSCWVLFWYNFRLWTTPLFLLIPFFYFWICNRHHLEKSFMRGYGIIDEDDGEKGKNGRTLTGRLQEIPEMTLTITNGVDYIAALSEKLYNLASFKVPFLSYLTMILLVVASAGLYLIPFNYTIMFLGIYKFSRKYMKPDRILNNDLEDFLSRIPDSELLNDWKELNVPEPPLSPINGINVGNDPYTMKDSVMY